MSGESVRREIVERIVELRRIAADLRVAAERIGDPDIARYFRELANSYERDADALEAALDGDSGWGGQVASC